MNPHPTQALGRVDPDMQARVQDLMESAVRAVRQHLINRLGFGVPVRFGGVATLTFGELCEQFLDEGAGVYVRFEFEPGGVQGLLAIDGALLHRIMGLLLGEDPYGEPSAYIWRPPTRMDLSVAERLASDLFAGVLDSLPAGTGGRIRILEVSGNPRVELPIAPSISLYDVTLDVGPPEDPYGLLTLALPLSFAAAVWPEAVRARPTSDPGVHRVLPLPVELVAELARLRMPLGSVRDLAEGDLLRLGSTSSVRLSLAGRPAFSGEAGVVGGTRCVRVVRKHLSA